MLTKETPATAPKDNPAAYIAKQGPEYDKLPFKPTVTDQAGEYLAERDGWVLRCRRAYVQASDKSQPTDAK